MATVQIDVDGVDITDDVVIAEASFSSFVNGTPGTCSFMVKDTPGTRTITTGKDITLWIDGSRNWRGFVSQVARAFLFDAEDTAGKTERFFRVTGADVNVLFRKRIIVNQSDPLNGGKIYKFSGTKTSDQTALDELFANWIDLSGDGLTTLSTGTGGGIEFVGYINEDQDTEPWQAGWTWGQAMDAIAMLPAAIYYIDPDKVVVYTDAGGTGVSGEIDLDPADANAPFVLSDDLTIDTSGIGVPALGYADMEILADGSNLATDVLVWGMGTGSDKPVFTRVQDDPESHGRWQHGEVHYNVYKQGTTDRIASSVLRGSATSRRGHRRDKIAVTCTVWEPGFRVAQKVIFFSSAYSFAAILPIRKVEISFPEGNPKWELTLSSEIDAPWTFYDVFNIKLPDLQNFDVPFGIGRWTTQPPPTYTESLGGGGGQISSANGSGTSDAATLDDPTIPVSAPWPSDFVFSSWDITTVGTLGEWFTVDGTGTDLGFYLWSAEAVKDRYITPWTPPSASAHPALRLTGSVITDKHGSTPYSTIDPVSIAWSLEFRYEGGNPLNGTSGDDYDLTGRAGFGISSGVSAFGSPSPIDSVITNPGAPGYLILRCTAPSQVPERYARTIAGTVNQLSPFTGGWDFPGDAPTRDGVDAHGGQITYVSGLVASDPPVITRPPSGGGGQTSSGGFTGTTLQLPSPYAFGSPKVFKNGKIIARNIDYTETNPLAGVITLAVAAVVSDRWNVIYRVINPLGGTSLPTRLRTSYS